MRRKRSWFRWFDAAPSGGDAAIPPAPLRGQTGQVLEVAIRDDQPSTCLADERKEDDCTGQRENEFRFHSFGTELIMLTKHWKPHPWGGYLRRRCSSRPWRSLSPGWNAFHRRPSHTAATMSHSAMIARIPGSVSISTPGRSRRPPRHLIASARKQRPQDSRGCISASWRRSATSSARGREPAARGSALSEHGLHAVVGSRVTSRCGWKRYCLESKKERGCHVVRERL